MTALKAVSTPSEGHRHAAHALPTPKEYRTNIIHIYLCATHTLKILLKYDPLVVLGDISYTCMQTSPDRAFGARVLSAVEENRREKS